MLKTAEKEDQLIKDPLDSDLNDLFQIEEAVNFEKSVPIFPSQAQQSLKFVQFRGKLALRGMCNGGRGTREEGRGKREEGRGKREKHGS